MDDANQIWEFDSNGDNAKIYGKESLPDTLTIMVIKDVVNTVICMYLIKVGLSKCWERIFCEHKPPFLLSTIPVDAVEVISKVVVNSVTFYTVKHH